MFDAQSNRRAFLASLSFLPFLGPTEVLATDAGIGTSALADPTRELQPAFADLGTNFAAVEQIAASGQSSLFPPGKTIVFDEAFRAQARTKVREVLSYDPPQVDFQPEVVERVDCGDY